MKVQELIKNSGIYILELLVQESFLINSIKKTGVKNFRPGYYYYVGSAQKNLISRLERHLRKEKKVHWHIDHLTTRNDVIITNVFVAEEAARSLECEMADNLSKLKSVIFFPENFGNSDCNKCKSHLLYSAEKPDYNHLLSRYHFTVFAIPSSSEIS